MNSDTKTIDPICGMTVDPRTALSAEKNSVAFYFCSKHCLEKFYELPDVNSDAEDCCQRKVDATPHYLGNYQPSLTAKYFCPMCEGIESDKPDDCPKCGMALEPTGIAPGTLKSVFTCPMHPDIELAEPGACPICGMDLEPSYVTADAEEDDTELNSMTRRFWIAVVLSVPVLMLAMLPMFGVAIEAWAGGSIASRWMQFVFATPVVCWCGFPFFVRGWRSIPTWNLNMFSLISLGSRK